MRDTAFRFGDWRVRPETLRIERDGREVVLEPRWMQVLCALCARPGEVLSAEDLLRLCWGSAVYGDGPVHKAIAQLRRALGDDRARPRYIETIRTRGYRTVAAVAAPGEGALPAPASWRGCPFRGLEPFGPDHGAVFHGRERACVELVAALRRQVARGHAMVLLLGPSGSGKTSLLQAGLRPALSAPEPSDTPVLACADLDLTGLEGAPWPRLSAALQGLRIDDRPLLPPQPADVLARRLAESPDTVLTELRWHLDPLPRSGPGPRLLLTVDPLERLFLAHTADRGAVDLLRVLDLLARSGEVAVVMACRNDFYPQVARDPTLMSLKTERAHVDLASPTAADIARMIRLPARAAGLRYGRDPHTGARLDDVLCAAAAAGSDVLPLLQHTLERLYATRDRFDTLRFEAYEDMGGLDGAIGHRAESVLSAQPASVQACLPSLLARLVVLHEDGSAVGGRRLPWSALTVPAERALARALVDARLLASDYADGDPAVRVAHEALLHRWPRVTGWVDQHRLDLRARARVAAQASRWRDAGGSADLLLPEGRQLDEALRLRETRHLPLGTDELALIAASQRRARRRRRRRIALTGAVAALALLASMLAAAAYRANQRAQAQRAQADALMGAMLGDFAARLRPLGRTDLLEHVSSLALDHLATAPDATLDSAARHQRVRALLVIVEVQYGRGDAARAARALAAADALLAQDRDGVDSVERLRLGGTGAFWRGQLCYDREAWQCADAAFGDYLRWARAWRRHRPADVDALVEESYAFNSLGSVAVARGRHDDAARSFARSAMLKREALGRRPADDALADDLADSLSWLATAQQRDGRPRDATRTLRHALAVIRSRPRAATDAGRLHREAMAMLHLAESMHASGETVPARRVLADARVRLGRATTLAPDRADWRHDALYAGVLEQRWRPPAAAAPATLHALEREAVASMRREPAHPQWPRLAAWAALRRAEALAARGRSHAARSALDTAARHAEHAWRLAPEAFPNRIIVAETALALAAVQPDDETIRRPACARAMSVLGGHAGASRDRRLSDPWRRARSCLRGTAARPSPTTAKPALHRPAARNVRGAASSLQPQGLP